MKIKEVVSALERFAPLPLQEDFDNAGLQIGLTEAEVSGALLCLDVTEAVVDEAVEKNKLRRVTDEDYVQRAVMKAIQKGVAIVSMHTNMDSAQGGVNHKIAEKMSLRELAFFGTEKVVDGVQGGAGVVGILPTPMAADDFVLMLKRTFDVECVQANELLRRPISKVALCGGAGSFLLPEAIRQGADAFVTGEMHYHDYFGHEQEIQIAVIGHFQSEQYTSEIFQSIIEERCPGVRCCLTEVCTNPIIYF